MTPAPTPDPVPFTGYRKFIVALLAFLQFTIVERTMTANLVVHFRRLTCLMVPSR